MQRCRPPRGDRQDVQPKRIGHKANKDTIRPYFEVTEVGAGFGQGLVGKPDCESNEPVVPFLIGHRSPSASAPPRTKPRDREPGGPNSMKAAGCSTYGFP